MLDGNSGDFGAVGRDHTLLGHADLSHVFPDAKHQRFAGEQSERFSGEAGGSQSCWDDGERLHAWRLNALSEETVTPVECRLARER
jgi:hypothetical protein